MAIQDITASVSGTLAGPPRSLADPSFAPVSGVQAAASANASAPADAVAPPAASTGANAFGNDSGGTGEQSTGGEQSFPSSGDDGSEPRGSRLDITA